MTQLLVGLFLVCFSLSPLVSFCSTGQLGKMPGAGHSCRSGCLNKAQLLSSQNNNNAGFWLLNTLSLKNGRFAHHNKADFNQRYQSLLQYEKTIIMGFSKKTGSPKYRLQYFACICGKKNTTVKIFHGLIHEPKNDLVIRLK